MHPNNIEKCTQEKEQCSEGENTQKNKKSINDTLDRANWSSQSYPHRRLLLMGHDTIKVETLLEESFENGDNLMHDKDKVEPVKFIIVFIHHQK